MNSFQETSTSILDADEDDQMAAAIRASLAEAARQTSKKAFKYSNSDDSDDDDDDSSIEAFTPTKESSNSAPPSRSELEGNYNPGTSSSSFASMMDKGEPLIAADGLSTNTTNGSSWEDYLGNKDDAKASIMIRFPDGKRVTKNIPCSSQFLVCKIP
jgi:hypothetical protein